MEDNGAVLDYYEHLYDEDSRNFRNPLEFIRTKEIISRYLGNRKISIADICGATGVYSYWLALQGHEVHLLDLSSKHIEQAIRNKDRYHVELKSLTCGDARKLPYADEAFDMVLLMGALYHLQEQKQRLDCIKEAYRVLKSGGIAVFSFISRYASLIDGFKDSLVEDPEFLTIIDKDLASGKHDNPSKHEHYFTTAFLHTPQLVYEELRLGRFPDVELFAVEGFANALDSKADIEVILKYLRMTERVPELMGVSSHFLAVCKKP